MPDFALGALCATTLFLFVYCVVTTVWLRRGMSFLGRFNVFSGNRSNGEVVLSGKFGAIQNGQSKPGLFAQMVAGDAGLQDAIKRDEERAS